MGMGIFFMARSLANGLCVMYRYNVSQLDINSRFVDSGGRIPTVSEVIRSCGNFGAYCTFGK